jgi:hypothetical protein
VESGCRTEAFFITLGGRQAHDSSGADDKGRRRSPLKPKMLEWATQNIGRWCSVLRLDHRERVKPSHERVPSAMNGRFLAWVSSLLMAVSPQYLLLRRYALV